MNNIQFLGNEAVQHLLINLTKDEAIAFRNAIEQTFEDFSAAGERQYQPDPSSATPWIYSFKQMVLDTSDP